LPAGDRGENMQAAIGCCQAALRVYAEDRFPQDWAMTQNNLGVAHANLPAGDRGENLQAAIGYYQAALRVRTEDRFPQDWATTQNNLGLALRDSANHPEELALALTAFRNAERGYLAIGLEDDAQRARQAAERVEKRLSGS
ncbi:MAG TPA: hypothetical protein VH092_17435, partial [Urbifossiella sp.]|nr:hypothetical protein [Urbifossiella sp.]